MRNVVCVEMKQLRSPTFLIHDIMNHLTTGLLLTLASCGLFSTPDVVPALEVNVQMQRVFESHSGAFEKLMLTAKMDESFKLIILGMIQKDRAVFTRLNTSMSQFIGALGELSPKQITDFMIQMKDLYNEVKKEAEGPGPSSAPNTQ